MAFKLLLRYYPLLDEILDEQLSCFCFGNSPTHIWAVWTDVVPVAYCMCATFFCLFGHRVGFRSESFVKHYELYQFFGRVPPSGIIFILLLTLLLLGLQWLSLGLLWLGLGLLWLALGILWLSLHLCTFPLLHYSTRGRLWQ